MAEKPSEKCESSLVKLNPEVRIPLVFSARENFCPDRVGQDPGYLGLGPSSACQTHEEVVCAVILEPERRHSPRSTQFSFVVLSAIIPHSWAVQLHGLS